METEMKSTNFICEHASDIPKVDHFAIIEFTSITIPGDEHSRTNPGHGYPESTKNVSIYRAYVNKEEWEQEINKRETSIYRSREYVAIVVKVPKIEIITKVSIS